MKQQIHDTILAILAEKRADGDVLPFVTATEVAQRLQINADEVEFFSRGSGISGGRAINGEFYYYE